MYKSVKNKILSRIYGYGRGRVFSANDFLLDFSRYEIDTTLKTLTDNGTIRRICRGIYDFPQFSSILKTYAAPNMNAVAQTIARKFNWKIYPEGNTALNYFGLSTQVPAKLIYISNGPSRIFKTEFGEIKFKHSALRESHFKYIESALVVQALRSLGQNLITDDVLQKLKTKYNSAMWQKIKLDTISVTGWIYVAICKIAGEE